MLNVAYRLRYLHLRNLLILMVLTTHKLLRWWCRQLNRIMQDVGAH